MPQSSEAQEDRLVTAEQLLGKVNLPFFLYHDVFVLFNFQFTVQIESFFFLKAVSSLSQTFQTNQFNLINNKALYEHYLFMRKEIQVAIRETQLEAYTIIKMSNSPMLIPRFFQKLMTAFVDVDVRMAGESVIVDWAMQSMQAAISVEQAELALMENKAALTRAKTELAHLLKLRSFMILRVMKQLAEKKIADAEKKIADAEKAIRTSVLTLQQAQTNLTLVVHQPPVVANQASFSEVSSSSESTLPATTTTTTSTSKSAVKTAIVNAATKPAAAQTPTVDPFLVPPIEAAVNLATFINTKSVTFIKVRVPNGSACQLPFVFVCLTSLCSVPQGCFVFFANFFLCNDFFVSRQNIQFPSPAKPRSSDMNAP